MRIQSIILSFTFFLFPLSAISGSNHDHGHSHVEVTQVQVEKAAIDKILSLVDKGKLDSSWKSTPAKQSTKTLFGRNMEWVVSFKNGKISDKEKQTLYMFYSLSGKYLAANYTGK